MESYASFIVWIGLSLVVGPLVFYALAPSRREPEPSEPPPPPLERSKRGTWEPLTDYEKLFIEVNRTCPDCDTGQLLKGPEGGFQSVKCARCGAKFNLGPTLGGDVILFGSHRGGP